MRELLLVALVISSFVAYGSTTLEAAVVAAEEQELIRSGADQADWLGWYSREASLRDLAKRGPDYFRVL